MRAIVIAGAVWLASVGSIAWADEPAPLPTPKIPPNEVTVKIVAPDGASDADIAHGIAEEHARRDPAAQEAASVAKHKADADEAHHARVNKVCDAIPEDALARDPSLRRMCAE